MQNVKTPQPPFVPAPSSFIAAPSAQFETSSESPFSDKYCIEGERKVLKHLLEADDPDPLDPLFERLELLEQREKRLLQMQTEWRLRAGAENAVPYNEARRMQEIGTLEDESVDTMALHTREAFRMFMGRVPDTEKKYRSIVGSKRAAAALKSLWYCSANDNPYADWALLRHTQLSTELSELISSRRKECEDQIDMLARNGFKISLLRSASPETVELGFKSPYGYGIADRVVQFDLLVRMIKTMVRKDRFTDRQGQERIREVSRSFRGGLEEIIHFERYLMKAELRELSRADFLPGANAEGVKRAAAAKAIYGPVPTDIFTGKVVPRHSKRRTKVTEQELALLHAMAESQNDEAADDKVLADEEGLL